MASQPDQVTAASGQRGDLLPGPAGPALHELVTADLPGVYAPPLEKQAAADLLAQRCGRREGPWLASLRRSLADAALYARQGIEADGPGEALGHLYEDILDLLCRAAGMEGGEQP